MPHLSRAFDNSVVVMQFGRVVVMTQSVKFVFVTQFDDVVALVKQCDSAV